MEGPGVDSPVMTGVHRQEAAGSPGNPAGGVRLAEGGFQWEVAALPHRGGGDGCVGASLRSAQRHRQPPQPHGNYGNIHLTLTPSNEEFQDKGQSNLHHT